MPLFQKRHYEAVAKLIASCGYTARPDPHNPNNAPYWVPADPTAEDFAKLFKADNPAFDHKRFLKACTSK